MSHLMSTDDVSELTGIPAETLRYWRWRGEGPISFKLGRHVVYERTDVMGWIAASKDVTAVGSIGASS